jgi:catechol 2,3-dioxygenase-like lactoylglutathione lyase family enzyme
MLYESEVIGFIPTADAERARTFYEEVLGLHFVSDDSFALVMESRGTVIRITKVGEFKPAPYTILGWRVQNVEKEAKTLHSRGVSFQQYPPLQQDELGIWTAPGGTKIAWFLDPDGNVLSLSQH